MGGRQLQSCFGRQILGGDFLGGVSGLLGFGSFGGGFGLGLLGGDAAGEADGCFGAGRAYHLVEDSAGQDDRGEYLAAGGRKHSLAKHGQADGYACLGN